MASPNTTPSGLISFMCWVMHDPTTNRNFHADEVEVMNQFGLDDATKDQILKIGEHHDDSQGRDLAEQLFDVHLLEPFLEIWTTSIASSVSQPPNKSGWISLMYYARYDEAANITFRGDPSQIMTSFGIMESDAIKNIKKIAQAPGAPAAKDAAKYIFKTYVVGEFLETKSPKFW